MKKLIVFLFGVMLLALGKAEASVPNMTAQLGVYSTVDSRYGLEVDNNNDFYFATTGASIIYPSNTGTTNQTLTINNSGQTFIFTGTSAHTQFILPTCNVMGMDFDLLSNVAKTWAVQVQSTDTIQFSGESAGLGIANSSGAQGDEVELFCGVANTWSIKNKLGTWAAGN